MATHLTDPAPTCTAPGTLRPGRYAAIDIGTVSSVCNDALWGYTVTIDHDNGVTSRYCGLDGSLEVREGDAVQSGQKLGTAGNTADIESSQDSHLHLEIRRSGEYLDPMAYLQ